MASASTDYKRLFLRGAKWDSETASISLFAQLKLIAQAKLTDTASGMVLTGTATNGHSVTLQLPENGRGFTPQILTELSGEMIDRWEAAVAYLQLETDYESSENDTAIFARMMDLLKAAKQVQMDVTMLRIPASGVMS